MDSGDLCDMSIIGEGFSSHLRECHGAIGDGPVTCQWLKCGTVMQTDNLTRHVTEMHLEYRYPCPACENVYTRRTTLNRHITTQHPEHN
ncbi:hypothetical protein ID866_7092 [Astraeus odoratus]|nr:hypothetical protein ID866_7092 [Astraeus odoratus]